ncbi:MAG: leucine-rich repeat domain-containing protein, partial [Acetatifactor sp.]|nr:leucine-rich repeat domain-containing protein [Acetatifactor sp.]
MSMEDIYIQNGSLDSYTGRAEILTIPEGVHTIGEGALKGCASLKKVILPLSLRRILGGAFMGCRRREEVEIPAGLCEVGE